jgi:hypothetical protein
VTPVNPLPMDRRIQTLHDRLSELFERKGNLPGGDAVTIVDSWFEEIGKPLPNLDPDGEFSGDRANPDRPT